MGFSGPRLKCLFPLSHFSPLKRFLKLRPPPLTCRSPLNLHEAYPGPPLKTVFNISKIFCQSHKIAFEEVSDHSYFPERDWYDVRIKKLV